MRSLSIVLGALVIPSCVQVPASSTEQAIVGGEIADPADYRAVVALEEGPGNWFCTGTLIAPTWVLTAAHCVEGSGAGDLQVRFDDANVNDQSGGRVVEVAAVHSHPGFDWEAWDNDIALVELAEAVTDRAPTPIQRTPVAFGTAVIDVGYGVADNNDNGGGILREVAKTTADCAGAGDPGVSNANLVCMDAADGRGSCFGDSGGPTYATVGGALVVAGVTSGGTGDACGAGWDLYTSISAELDFLDSVMGAVVDPDPTDPDPEPTDPEPTDPTDPDPTDPLPTDPVGGDTTDSGGGCNTGTGGGGGALALLGLLAVRRRRRA